MSLPHFSVSSAMSLLKSAGESASTSPPRLASLALILGSARPALISLLSLSMISPVWPSVRRRRTSCPSRNPARTGGERHLHLSAEQVTQCKGDAAIRHMHHVDSGHHLEQLARNVVANAGAGRRHVEFTGIGLGIESP
jgi:hypothetical protein